MQKNKSSIVWMLLGMLLMFSALLPTGILAGTGGTSTPEISSTPAACASGQVLNQVQEDASGNLLLSCVVVNGESATSASCASNQFMTNVAESSSGTITITCVQPSFNALTNYPPNCSTNQFVYGINGGLLCSQIPFNGLSSYPPNCSTNQFVYGINGGLLCSQVPFSGLSSYPPNCSTNQFVYGINGGLLCSQVPFNGLSNYPTNCASNQLVYGISSSGLLCNPLTAYVKYSSGSCSTTGTSTYEMAGFALKITTKDNHNLTLTLVFNAISPSASHVAETASLEFMYGTGTAPSCNSALTGSGVSNQIYSINAPSPYSTSNMAITITQNGMLSGLTSGTTYWFDIAFKGSATGWTLSNAVLTAIQL